MKNHRYGRGPKLASGSGALAALLALALGATSCSGSEPRSAEPTERSTTGTGAATPSTSPVQSVGAITTVVGNGFPASSGDDGPATEASISGPWVIGFDAEGNLYITDADLRVRKIDPTGAITTVVGPPAGGQSAPGEAGSVEGQGLAVDPQGNLYVDNPPGLVVKVTPSGDVTTVAGTGKEGYSGDSGPATEARISTEYAGTAVDAEGNLYIAQYEYHVVRKIDAAGIITTIAGTGKPGFSGDGGPAVKAQLNGPTTVGVDGEGNVYVSDLENHRIRRIDTNGIITTVAGNGERGFPDGSVATEVPIGGADVHADVEGNIYITDEGFPGIFKVDSEGILTVLAGTGEDGYSGDRGPATEAQLSEPTTVAIGPDGNLYIADWGNNRIRMVVLTP